RHPGSGRARPALLAPEPLSPARRDHGRHLRRARDVAEPPARLHRPALARPRGLLRHWRLYFGAPHAQARLVVLARARGRRRAAGAVRLLPPPAPPLA